MSNTKKISYKVIILLFAIVVGLGFVAMLNTTKFEASAGISDDPSWEYVKPDYNQDWAVKHQQNAIVEGSTSDQHLGGAVTPEVKTTVAGRTFKLYKKGYGFTDDNSTWYYVGGIKFTTTNNQDITYDWLTLSENYGYYGEHEVAGNIHTGSDTPKKLYGIGDEIEVLSSVQKRVVELQAEGYNPGVVSSIIQKWGNCIVEEFSLGDGSRGWNSYGRTAMTIFFYNNYKKEPIILTGGFWSFMSGRGTSVGTPIGEYFEFGGKLYQNFGDCYLTINGTDVRDTNTQVVWKKNIFVEGDVGSQALVEKDIDVVKNGGTITGWMYKVSNQIADADADMITESFIKGYSNDLGYACEPVISAFNTYVQKFRSRGDNGVLSTKAQSETDGSIIVGGASVYDSLLVFNSYDRKAFPIKTFVEKYIETDSSINGKVGVAIGAPVDKEFTVGSDIYQNFTFGYMKKSGNEVTYVLAMNVDEFGVEGVLSNGIENIGFLAFGIKLPTGSSSEDVQKAFVAKLKLLYSVTESSDLINKIVINNRGVKINASSSTLGQEFTDKTSNEKFMLVYNPIDKQAYKIYGSIIVAYNSGAGYALSDRYTVTSQKLNHNGQEYDIKARQEFNDGYCDIIEVDAVETAVYSYTYKIVDGKKTAINYVDTFVGIPNASNTVGGFDDTSLAKLNVDWNDVIVKIKKAYTLAIQNGEELGKPYEYVKYWAPAGNIYSKIISQTFVGGAYQEINGFNNTNGIIIYNPIFKDAFAVTGDFYNIYVKNSKSTDGFGYPVMAAMTLADGTKVQSFQNKTIFKDVEGNINVVDGTYKFVFSLEMNTEYKVGDALDTPEFKVNAKFFNKANEEVKEKAFEYSVGLNEVVLSKNNLDMNSIGIYEISYSYYTMSVTKDITVRGIATVIPGETTGCGSIVSGTNVIVMIISIIALAGITSMVILRKKAKNRNLKNM